MSLPHSAARSRSESLSSEGLRFGGPLGWPQRAAWRVATALRWTLSQRVEGMDQVPARGPAVVIAPHLAFSDSFPYLFTSLPRPPRFIASAFFVHRGALASGLMWAGGTIPAWQHRRDPLALLRALRALSRGELLVVFPEGGRSWTGVPAPPLAAAVKLLARLRVPVLVAAIDGAYDHWPRWDPRPRRRPIRVRIVGPLELPADALRGGGRSGAGRWWSSVYRAGGSVDVASARAAVRGALASAAAHEPRELDLRRPGRVEALPQLLCFCPECAAPRTFSEGGALRCAGCGRRWRPEPEGRLREDAKEEPPQPLEEVFLRMLGQLEARAGEDLVLDEPVEVRTFDDAAPRAEERRFVPGRARLTVLGLDVSAGGSAWALPIERVVRGAMEGADVLALHASGLALQLRGPGAFRLFLAARALRRLPGIELPA